jgi:murein DD-endopeptidase MepM/ murein hydrolase activator NlpD
MQRLFRFLFLALLFYSCSTTTPGIFGKQSFHAQYGKKLTDAGLKQTAVGASWFAAAEAALQQPVAVSVPYKEAGYFAAEKPRAVGLQFQARRGEKLLIQVEKKSHTPFILYADLWKAYPTPVLKTFLDTARLQLEYEVEDSGAYILRLQPELLSAGMYTVSITTGPSLGFPVAGTGARVGSLWGDARDAGARKHEGIDIFAPKRTPVVAAESGVVTAVNENALGGKVVWMRPQQRNYVLYYAHLDEQLVQSQQRVNKGDTLGLMGNTGNARTTAPHLHFGIYTAGGAIDPLPFVNQNRSAPPEVNTQLFKTAIRLAASASIDVAANRKKVKAQTYAEPVAVTATAYRVLFPDGTIGVVPLAAARDAEPPVRTVLLKDSALLLDKPHPAALAIRQLSPATTVTVIGLFNEYTLVQTAAGEKGWVTDNVLK